ncbi:histidine phosphatase family protein [Clostridium estertheticum]|uniref:Histidine phosphatase family protein n=1 Tax=Clostridium estertheticum TaxID=238834 RepID=A0A7Y3SYQ6_9CLOT|nr:hypothetical protein [Clostridium estertheticum]
MYYAVIEPIILSYIKIILQIENKKDTQKRVNEFLDSIKDESSNNILIVCHGFFMNTLQKELKSRGFTGRTIRTPKNGTLYLYKK